MKSTNRSTICTLAAEEVANCLQRAESYEHLVIEDQDPEDLHQMRVNLRRLRTATQVFKPGIVLPKAGEEAQVKKVFGRLGKLRDLDVIFETLQNQYAPDLPSAERRTLEAIFDHLLKQRKKAYKRAKTKLKGDRYNHLKRSLYRWASKPKCNALAELSIYEVLPDLTLPTISQLWLHPGWFFAVEPAKKDLKPDTTLSSDQVDKLLADQGDVLHSLRKQVKRVRYQLTFVSEFYGDRIKDHLSKLAKLQSALGKLQDSLVIEAALEAVMPDWQTALPTLKSLVSDSRHQAWKRWQTLQQYYLDTSNRHSLRQILITPGKTLESSTHLVPEEMSHLAVVGVPEQSSDQIDDTGDDLNDVEQTPPSASVSSSEIPSASEAIDSNTTSS
ncbi:CHAD domain-containing protein [Oscillatoria sp. CS-180]|uniref:CHAD domain-containing protein n=1 Tax=Oscillatoria sp. CS-180 TaxID=3021720 RepID=UPI00232B0F01|nr:CHAD domain-containing protein [Oscillatoria sp. CS-180]MDB9526652.1 CHAD domain-containing protein [Oscillatoria sp. CS-180]